MSGTAETSQKALELQTGSNELFRGFAFVVHLDGPHHRGCPADMESFTNVLKRLIYRRICSNGGIIVGIDDEYVDGATHVVATHEQQAVVRQARLAHSRGQDVRIVGPQWVLACVDAEQHIPDDDAGMCGLFPGPHEPGLPGFREVTRHVRMSGFPADRKDLRTLLLHWVECMGGLSANETHATDTSHVVTWNGGSLTAAQMEMQRRWPHIRHVHFRWLFFCRATWTLVDDEPFLLRPPALDGTDPFAVCDTSPPQQQPNPFYTDHHHHHHHRHQPQPQHSRPLPPRDQHPRDQGAAEPVDVRAGAQGPEPRALAQELEAREGLEGQPQTLSEPRSVGEQPQFPSPSQRPAGAPAPVRPLASQQDQPQDLQQQSQQDQPPALQQQQPQQTATEEEPSFRDDDGSCESDGLQPQPTPEPPQEMQPQLHPTPQLHTTPQLHPTPQLHFTPQLHPTPQPPPEEALPWGQAQRGEDTLSAGLPSPVPGPPPPLPPPQPQLPLGDLPVKGEPNLTPRQPLPPPHGPWHTHPEPQAPSPTRCPVPPHNSGTSAPAGPRITEAVAQGPVPLLLLRGVKQEPGTEAAAEQQSRWQQREPPHQRPSDPQPLPQQEQRQLQQRPDCWDTRWQGHPQQQQPHPPQDPQQCQQQQQEQQQGQHLEHRREGQARTDDAAATGMRPTAPVHGSVVVVVKREPDWEQAPPGPGSAPSSTQPPVYVSSSSLSHSLVLSNNGGGGGDGESRAALDYPGQAHTSRENAAPPAAASPPPPAPQQVAPLSAQVAVEAPMIGAIGAVGAFALGSGILPKQEPPTPLPRAMLRQQHPQQQLRERLQTHHHHNHHNHHLYHQQEEGLPPRPPPRQEPEEEGGPARGRRQRQGLAEGSGPAPPPRSPLEPRDPGQQPGLQQQEQLARECHRWRLAGPHKPPPGKILLAEQTSQAPVSASDPAGAEEERTRDGAWTDPWVDGPVGLSAGPEPNGDAGAVEIADDCAGDCGGEEPMETDPVQYDEVLHIHVGTAASVGGGGGSGIEGTRALQPVGQRAEGGAAASPRGPAAKFCGAGGGHAVVGGGAEDAALPRGGGGGWLGAFVGSGTSSELSLRACDRARARISCLLPSISCLLPAILPSSDESAAVAPPPPLLIPPPSAPTGLSAFAPAPAGQCTTGAAPSCEEVAAAVAPGEVTQAPSHGSGGSRAGGGLELFAGMGPAGRRFRGRLKVVPPAGPAPLKMRPDAAAAAAALAVAAAAGEVREDGDGGMEAGAVAAASGSGSGGSGRGRAAEHGQPETRPGAPVEAGGEEAPGGGSGAVEVAGAQVKARLGKRTAAKVIQAAGDAGVTGKVHAASAAEVGGEGGGPDDTATAAAEQPPPRKHRRRGGDPTCRARVVPAAGGAPSKPPDDPYAFSARGYEEEEEEEHRGGRGTGPGVSVARPPLAASTATAVAAEPTLGEAVDAGPGAGASGLAAPTDSKACRSREVIGREAVGRQRSAKRRKDPGDGLDQPTNPVELVPPAGAPVTGAAAAAAAGAVPMPDVAVKAVTPAAAVPQHPPPQEQGPLPEDGGGDVEMYEDGSGGIGGGDDGGNDDGGVDTVTQLTVLVAETRELDTATEAVARSIPDEALNPADRPLRIEQGLPAKAALVAAPAARGASGKRGRSRGAGAGGSRVASGGETAAEEQPKLDAEPAKRQHRAEGASPAGALTAELEAAVAVAASGQGTAAGKKVGGWGRKAAGGKALAVPAAPATGPQRGPGEAGSTGAEAQAPSPNTAADGMESAPAAAPPAGATAAGAKPAAKGKGRAKSGGSGGAARRSGTAGKEAAAGDNGDEGRRESGLSPEERTAPPGAMQATVVQTQDGRGGGGGGVCSPSGRADGAGVKLVFALSGFTADERSQYGAMLKALRLSYIPVNSDWDPRINALLAPSLKRSDKTVCALASGAWLLRAEYLAACQQAASAAAGGGAGAGSVRLDPEPYELQECEDGPSVIATGAPAHWRRRCAVRGGACGAFSGLRLLVPPGLPGPLDSATLARMVTAGGGGAVIKGGAAAAKGCHAGLVPPGCKQEDKLVSALRAAGAAVVAPAYVVDWVAHPHDPLTAHYRHGTAPGPELAALEADRGVVGGAAG